METKEFITSGTCSKKITFNYENGKMYNLQFEYKNSLQLL
jgi:hypothetical protein